MTEDSRQAIATVAAIDAVPTLLEVICRVTGLRFAAVARVTADRWLACATLDEMGMGLVPGSELPISATFCQRIHRTGEPVVFHHGSADPVYAEDPVTRLYKLESYISFPILLRDGSMFGTLCALDLRPRAPITAEILGLFRLFCDLIAFHIDAQARVSAMDAELREERVTAALREEFVAILSHDLRNPLASLAAGLRILRRHGTDPQSAEVLALMDASIARMSRLITDTTDFARVRLGGGLEISRGEAVAVAPIIRQAADELSLSHPGRSIVIAAEEAFLVCDASRLAQLVSNLLGNALVHGTEDGEVALRAGVEGDHYVLRVSNPGEPIPPDLLRDMFKPFVHSGHGKRDGGLGLGLFIADQIARAHRGTLEVSSDPAATVFTLRLPLD